MTPAPLPGPSSQRDLYDTASAAHSAALERLARSYEMDPDKQQDLLQDIHLALWRSFERFDGRCSMRTWVYRVAHNVATSHVVRQRRRRSHQFVSLDALDAMPDSTDTESSTDREMVLDRMYALIQQLAPLDRQVLLLYLEDVDAASIGEITGFSAGNVATKVHRIKKIIANRFSVGGRND
jgi:RNA polymerase sigma-70 factor (ECF subfamily)